MEKASYYYWAERDRLKKYENGIWYLWLHWNKTWKEDEYGYRIFMPASSESFDYDEITAEEAERFINSEA